MIKNIYFIVPAVLGRILLPMATFFFFCKYCRVPFYWGKGIGYVVLSIGLYGAETVFGLTGSAGLLLEIALLAWCGVLFLKRPWMESFMVSVLIMSVLAMSNGIICWIDRRVFFPMIMLHESLVGPADGVREFLKVLLVLMFYIMVLKKFRKGIASTNRQALFQLTIPLLFMALAERVIQVSFYSDTIEVDFRTGMITSVIDADYGEILFLQIFACVALLAVLFSYEKIIEVLRTEQDIRLLKQRFAEQEIYVEEAKLRYEQTRSFRHDIKNHLAILAELLKAHEEERAYEYLVRLEDISTNLSYAVQTGNTVVDALMGSKLSAARQKGIRIECEMKIPSGSRVGDMDWCIVLANALDNAIKGCDSAGEGKRYIKVTGKKKGNLYLIVVENGCDEGLDKVPEEGTGLANIRAVMEKNKGTAETEVSLGIYKLKLLFSC